MTRNKADDELLAATRPMDQPERPLTVPRTVSHETLDDDAFWDEQRTEQTPGLRTVKQAAIPATTRPNKEPAPAWTRKVLGSVFPGWQEKQLAAKTSRELLNLHAKVAATRRGVTKRELYLLVVMARQGGALADAEKVLTRATESFATWPVERALTFRDVVHYLAVSEYLASTNDEKAWTRESFGRVVASIVPDGL